MKHFNPYAILPKDGAPEIGELISNCILCYSFAIEGWFLDRIMEKAPNLYSKKEHVSKKMVYRFFTLSTDWT